MMTIILVVVAFAYILVSSKNKNWPKWPLVGTLPSLVLNLHRIQDALVDMLEANRGTVLLRFGLSDDMDILLTTDPEDVRHIMQTKAEVYIKGEEWKKRFDVFGNSYFNAETEDSKLEKVGIRSFLAHQQLHRLMVEAYRDSFDKLATSLRHASERGTSIDLSDCLQKLMFRTTCRAFAGCELVGGSHERRFVEAIADAFEAILVRYFLPCWIWLTMRWLRLGTERRMRQARETLNEIGTELVSEKRRQLSNGTSDDTDFSAVKLYMTRHKFFEGFPADEITLRENIIALLFAAVDTTSTALAFFFWQLGNHPAIEEKIVEELKKWWPKSEQVLGFGMEELKEMVYLHATLCETLRLFPPVAFEARTPAHADTLPSGHVLTKRTKVLLPIYAMGRMKHIWGEDCREFMPERWITAEGGIRYIPPNKFFAFNAGQRMCAGKDIAFNLMKATIGNILYNYRVRMEKNYSVSLKTSILLHMSNNLMAKIEPRS